MTPLLGDFKPQVLLIGTDSSLRDTVVPLLVALGAEVTWRTSVAAASGEGGWDAVLLAGCQFASTGATSQEIRNSWETARSLTTGEVLWIAPAHSAAEAASVLALGAADLLTADDGPLLGARLKSHVELAKCRHLLATSSHRRRALEQERKERAEGLQALLAAHETLAGLSFPAETVQQFRRVLETLFPRAAVEVRVFEEPEGNRPLAVRRTEMVGGGGRWREVVVPIHLGDETEGQLLVSAAAGDSYPESRLDFVELLALQAAQALQRSRLYRALSVGKAEWEKTFDTIADCISIVGVDYTIRRANRAIANLLGKEPRDLVGQPCYRAFRTREEPCSRCPATRVFATGAPQGLDGECFDTARTFDYHAYPLKDGEGGLGGAVVYGRDTTREEVLRKSLVQSEKLMTVGQIAAGIAHEINNPLTAISSYAQLLSLRLTDPKGAESARRIEDGVSRIHRLVQNLTSFARPSEDTFYPLDLNDIVADTLSFCRYDLTRGETTLAQDLAPSLPKVLGAKDQLEQVLVSFLTNARDALGGRGTITVRTYARDGEAVIQVEDDGVGLGPEEVAKIFDPFYTTKPAGKGTGLGLFIAAGIARKHNAEILVESDAGRRTRFALSLPIFSP